jgi:hypothetical protein
MLSTKTGLALVWVEGRRFFVLLCRFRHPAPGVCWETVREATLDDHIKNHHSPVEKVELSMLLLTVHFSSIFSAL